MANEINDKFGASTAFTITLASLATSTTGVGRQTTLIDNTTVRAGRALVFAKIKLGTSPTGNNQVDLYLVRGDGNATPHRTDGAGASDAALTVLNAPLIGSLMDKASPATGDVLYGEFLVEGLGPEWGIAVVHNTGVNLDSTEANHWVRYVTITDEVQ